ncbi:hypothetical protein [Pedobacter sp.]
MLHLVDKSKVGRNLKDDSGEQIDWRNLFKSSEDSFTSSIFSLLSYLPASEFWAILTDSMMNFEMGEFEIPNKLSSITFWPRWNSNNSYCEPDVFVEFDTFDLIIEAKRWDYQQQFNLQWQIEIESYYSEFGERNKRLALLAIGGNAENLKTEIITFNKNSVPVLKLKWRRLLDTVNVKKKSIKPETNCFLHIYNDLVLSFRIHGFQTGLLFDTMPLNITLNEQNYESIKTNVPSFFKCQHLPNIVIENYPELIKIL